MTFAITRDSKFSELLLKNLTNKYSNKKRTESEPVHVSDILPSACLREKYYNRKLGDHLTDQSVLHFIRGESSEHIITDLLPELGIAQCAVEMDGITGTPDIRRKSPGADPSSFLVVELKDSARLSKRLESEDDQFKSYLYQALSYLVMTDIENAIIAIKYSVPELIWQKRDSKGNNYYIKPNNGRPPEIQSWTVFMSMDDPLREEIHSQMLERKGILQKALGEDDVSFLPRLIGKAKYIRCRKCQFYDICYKDSESESAIQIAREPAILDQLAVEIVSD